VNLNIVAINFITNQISLNDGRLYSFSDLDHRDLVDLLTIQNINQQNNHNLLDEKIRLLISKLEDITFKREFDHLLN
jgi:hypothetical protein